jgi:DNA-binding NarL/FixJ family response regulator
MSIRLLLADDHGVVRRGVRSLLSDYSEFLVVAETGNGRQAVELARQVQPDTVSRWCARCARRSRTPRW